MATTVIAENELYRSCEILFGFGLNINRTFLESYLQPSGIKTAYRKRVRETHPDLVATQSEIIQRKNAALFRAVQEAYDNLKLYLEAREKGFKLPSHANIRVRYSQTSGAGSNSYARNPDTDHKRKSAADWKRPRSDKFRNAQNSSRHRSSEPSPSSYDSINTNAFYQGPLPNRKLLFGHFLYYSGVINWKNIVHALVWQRSQRPKFGEIGRRLGWLSENDVSEILQQRTIFQPFGESAVKLGKLSQHQAKTIILQQKRLQKRIGAYFVEHKIVSQTRLNDLVVKYHAHNARQKSRIQSGCSH